jgi:hypothetical protein
MRLLKTLLYSIASLLLVVSAQAQTSDAKHFTKDGLSFDYSNGWTINDESNSDAQVLTLTRNDSDAQIKLFVHRGQVNTPEKMAEAKRQLIDPYVEQTSKQFAEMGAKPERTPASMEIGGAQAEGTRIQVVLDEPGEAGIYWIALGNRVVVLAFSGPTQALKKATPTWDLIRNSIKVEPQAESQPSPKPSPKP